jgi:Fe-S cluster assembly protein SufD
MIVEDRFSLQTISNNYQKALIEKSSRDAFFKEVADKAYVQLLETGLPANEQEEWKYVSLEPIFKTAYTSTSINIQIDFNNLILGNALEGCCGRLVLIDGHFSAEFSEMPQGLVCCSLPEALAKYPERVQAYFDNLESPNSFSLLNTVFFEDGLFIYLSKETLIDKPLHVLQINSQKGHFMSHPRLLICIAERSSLRLILETTGSSTAKYLTNIVTQIVLERDAKLHMAYVQNESQKAFQIGATEVKQFRNSELNLHSFSLGAHLSKHKIAAHLLEEGCVCSLNGLYVLSDSNQSHNQVVLNHLKPNCDSSQIYKGILDDEAHAEFSGTINVAKNAFKTDAKQLNRNLLISQKAKIDTRPQLQIEADDVKCSHGASVGQLEGDQLFYLLSRGISKDQAKGILTYGFAEEIIEKVKLPALRNKLDRLFLANIHSKS